MSSKYGSWLANRKNRQDDFIFLMFDFFFCPPPLPPFFFQAVAVYALQITLFYRFSSCFWSAFVNLIIEGKKDCFLSPLHSLKNIMCTQTCILLRTLRHFLVKCNIYILLKIFIFITLAAFCALFCLHG